MADTARVKAVREALTAAYAKADSAALTAWRARRDAGLAFVEVQRLASSIRNEGMRTAIEAMAKKIADDAAAAENAAAERRSDVGELLDLMGGAKQ